MVRRLRVAESPRGVGRLDSVPRLRLKLAYGLVFQTVNFRAVRARRFPAGRDRQVDGRGRTRKVSAIHGLEWVVMRYLCRMAVKLIAAHGLGRSRRNRDRYDARADHRFEKLHGNNLSAYF